MTHHPHSHEHPFHPHAGRHGDARAAFGFGPGSRPPFGPGGWSTGAPGSPGGYGPEAGHGRHPFGFGPGSGPRAEGGPGFGPGGGRGRRGGGPGGPGGPGGRGRGGRGGWRGAGGWQQADLPPADDAAAWLTGRLPDGWFVGAPTVSVDREEITVIGELPPVAAGDTGPATPADGATDGGGTEGGGTDGGGGTADAQAAAAAAGRITRFREDTRAERMAIDTEAQARYGRSIAWGARLGGTEQVFTNQSVPVMTRLRQPERQVLDTLVDAGVARSRSDALVWCVRLVGEHADEWLGRLREAMTEVDRLRGQGPDLD